MGLDMRILRTIVCNQLKTSLIAVLVLSPVCAIHPSRAHASDLSDRLDAIQNSLDGAEVKATKRDFERQQADFDRHVDRDAAAQDRQQAKLNRQLDREQAA